MGGKPKKGTPADMRLKRNKRKYGSVNERDNLRGHKNKYSRKLNDRVNLKK